MVAVQSVSQFVAGGIVVATHSSVHVWVIVVTTVGIAESQISGVYLQISREVSANVCKWQQAVAMYEPAKPKARG